MNTKFAIIAVVLGIVIVFGVVATGDFAAPTINDDYVFGVTLADPDLYKNGVYTEIFEIEPGRYLFSFVPNGDSPQTLSIVLRGDGFLYSEEFELKGTKIEAGISEYYIWDYLGKKEIIVLEPRTLEIEIDPHGNLKGPVSVQLVL